MFDRPETWFREPARALAPDALLTQPVEMLQGVTSAAAAALADAGIVSVLDLGASALFAVARSIAAAADGVAAASSVGPVPADMLDDAARGATAAAVAAMHPEVLRALPAGVAHRLADALPAATIRDLAYWPPAVTARRLVSDVYTGEIDTSVVDPEAPPELQPRLGRLPVDRVQYDVLLYEARLGEKVHDGLATVDPAAWDGGRFPLDLTDTLLGRGFEAPGFGFVLTVSQSWYGVGLSLGQLIHSLALAPGEATRVAVVDWSRRVATAVGEDIQEDEALRADIERNRSVAEVTRAVNSEAQSGFSRFNTTGAAWGLGAGAAGGAGDGQKSGSAAVNFGYSRNDAQGQGFASSQGSRDVTGEIVQRAHDRTQQHASLSRGRRASVVSEVSVTEAERLSTRVVANYNHMHALSVLYFEVVQLYRVVTECVAAEPVLYVPVRPLDFASKGLVERYRAALAAAALSAAARDAILGLTPPARPIAASKSRTGEVSFYAPGYTPVPYDQRGNELRDGGLRAALGESASIGPNRLTFDARRARLAEVQVGTVDASQQPVADTLAVRGLSRTQQVAFTKWATPPKDPVRFLPERGDSLTAFRAELSPGWERDERQVQLELEASWRWDQVVKRDELGFGPYVRVRLEVMDPATARETGDTVHFDLALPATREGAAMRLAALNFSGEETPTESAAPAPLPFDLEAHLQGNALHYTMAIVRQADPSLLGVLLGTAAGGGGSLLGQVDPVPVAAVGNYLVFRWPALRASHEWEKVRMARGLADADGRLVVGRRESLVPVASGGVFAEAVLGRFNSAEKLDLTRFWNWQDSPMPLVPPEIAPLQAGGRQGAAAVTPGTLSPAVLLPRESAALPDPTASLSAAIQAATKGDSFRDMSGLNSLLTAGGTAMTLAAQGAQTFMQTAMQSVSAYGARVNQGKSMDERAKADQASQARSDGAKPVGAGAGTGGGTGSSGTPGAPSRSPAEGAAGGSKSTPAGGVAPRSAEAEAFSVPGTPPADAIPSAADEAVPCTYVFSVIKGAAFEAARTKDPSNVRASRVDKELLDGELDLTGLASIEAPSGEVRVTLRNGVGTLGARMTGTQDFAVNGDLLVRGVNDVVTTIDRRLALSGVETATLELALLSAVTDLNRVRMTGEVLDAPSGGATRVYVRLDVVPTVSAERNAQLLGQGDELTAARISSTLDLADLLTSQPLAEAALRDLRRRIALRMRDHRDALAAVFPGRQVVVGFNVTQDASRPTTVELWPTFCLADNVRLSLG